MRDFYEILGVDRSATTDEIKTAFRRVAHESHPDKNPDDPESEERFKEATQAYEALIDPAARQRYDRGGANFVSGFEARGPEPGGGGGTGPGGEFHEIFGDIFGRRHAQAARARGKDRQVELEVDLFTALQGGERSIEIERSSRCSGCRGTGARPGSAPQI